MLKKLEPSVKYNLPIIGSSNRCVLPRFGNEDREREDQYHTLRRPSRIYEYLYTAHKSGQNPLVALNSAMVGDPCIPSWGSKQQFSNLRNPITDTLPPYNNSEFMKSAKARKPLCCKAFERYDEIVVILRL